MRKIIIPIISIIFIFLAGCKPNEEALLKKVEKKFNKIESYECLLNIEIDLEDSRSKYKMKESYRKGKSLVEILYPQENTGITLEYKEDKIIIENSSIEQSITLKKIKNLDKGFLVRDMVDNIKDFKLKEERLIDGKKYYVFLHTLKNPNKYSYQQLVFLDKKSLTPFSLEVIDRQGRPHTRIFYENFKNLS